MTTDWRDHAACRGRDPELFCAPDGESEPARGLREERAKRVCDACIVRTDCLEYALGRYEHGIWGGTTDDERARERRNASRRLGPKPEPAPLAAAGVKLCSGPCQAPKRLEEFGVRNESTDGRQYLCKACKAGERREQRRIKKEEAA